MINRRRIGFDRRGDVTESKDPRVSRIQRERIVPCLGAPSIDVSRFKRTLGSLHQTGIFTLRSFVLGFTFATAPVTWTCLGSLKVSSKLARPLKVMFFALKEFFSSIPSTCHLSIGHCGYGHQQKNHITCYLVPVFVNIYVYVLTIVNPMKGQPSQPEPSNEFGRSYGIWLKVGHRISGVVEKGGGPSRLGGGPP